ncbi:MAG: hypothetical protein R3F07_18845 [Opitutaceae bacterium]
MGNPHPALFRRLSTAALLLMILPGSPNAFADTPPPPALGKVIIDRNAADWESQQIFTSTPGAYYEWHQVSKVGDTYVLSIEVGVDAGKRWRPVIAVSTDPVSGWAQLDVDTVLQTRWAGLYSDETIYHVATPAFYRIEDSWYLYVQACPLPANRNYIDGHWDLWCFACDRKIPTLPGCPSLFIPGPTHPDEP